MSDANLRVFAEFSSVLEEKLEATDDTSEMTPALVGLDRYDCDTLSL